MQKAVVSAIVLAAGESRRMGFPKQFLKIGQSTILEKTVDNFLTSEAIEVIVVLGHKADEAAKLLADRRVIAVVNSNYEQGISSSITAGLQFIKSDSTGIMFALADQPFIDSKTINLLIEEFFQHPTRIVVPFYQGKRGNPTIFPRKYKKEFLSLHGDVGGREIQQQHPKDVLQVEVANRGVIADLDTLEDYNRELERTGSDSLN
jgi:molybdenum cofactor cytidylyltransferase